MVVEDNRPRLIALLPQVSQELLGRGNTDLPMAKPVAVAGYDLPVAVNSFGVPVALNQLFMVYFEEVSHSYIIGDSWQVAMN